ncbi:MAG TPA: helix-turn-helix domain-containing protein [Trebonia sp.]
MTSEPTNQPAPPSETDQREGVSITDPTVMRALAHPVRMALIELLGVRPTLTATQASEALGESPANCAFHLRTLAKYGFVEEAGGGRGRERPWRASTRSLRIRLRSSDLESEQARVAAGALEQVWYDRWFARIRTVFVNRRWSSEWEGAAGSSQTLTFLTPEELRGVRDEIDVIISRHLDERRLDPSKRPAGAMPVEIVSFAYPRQDLAAELAADGNDNGDPTAAPSQDIS